MEQSLSGLTDRGAEIIAEREAAVGEIEALRHEAKRSREPPYGLGPDAHTSRGHLSA